ncbi:hypothetical protein KKF84_09215 [Myxococcota bacterium]|nr:hypothetical protein [Myxococcota bacterium]MBU1535489.1 hypothetical protein [Myxococcota bacterium]
MKNLHLVSVMAILLSLSSCSPEGKSSTCGNNIIEGSEECDSLEFGSNTCLARGYYGGQMVCTSTCTLDESGCQAFGSCGDGVFQDEYEECEGGDVFGATCESLGYPSGNISCREDCRLDISQCEGAENCGDSLIQSDYEECEFYDFNGETCESLGYYGEGLACDDRCRFDLTICQLNGRCGDGMAQVQYEECDGQDQKGDTCESLNYYGGQIACNNDCTKDLSGCEAAGFCGDLVVQSPMEDCDGLDMGNATCAGQTDFYTDGVPTCLANCTIDFNGCGRCGDGVLQAGHEECDGQDIGSGTCREFGYFGGEVSGCESNCTAMGCGNLTVVDGGQYHSCGVDSAGNAWCWGYNNHGQLGNNSTTEERVPVAVQGMADAVHISAGREHSCAVLGDGSVWCWGNNSYGQLGLGTTTDQHTPQRVTFPGGTAILVSCGAYHTCAINSMGKVYCWGDNTSGKLGDGSATESHTPVLVGTVSSAHSISAGENHTCATQNGGTAWCWGNNYYGQLGEGSTNNSYTPQVVTTISQVAAIAVGNTHTCAFVIGGTAYCWGEGSNGKLGDGHTLDRSAPVQVDNLTGVTTISVGQNHSCASLSNGAVYCWGSNANGRLGDGTTTDSDTPVQAANIVTAVSLGLGDGYSCAVTSDGMGYCWGFNFHGQLGNGTAAQSLLPSLVEQPAP